MSLYATNIEVKRKDVSQWQHVKMYLLQVYGGPERSSKALSQKKQTKIDQFKENMAKK